jgi:hypothetical protein
MKTTLMAGLVVAIGLAAGSVRAADEGAGKPLTAEQQQQRTALITKYDVNTDGVLDKQEMKKLSRSDKKALAKLGGVGTAKKSAEPGATAKSKEEKAKAGEATEKAPEAKPESAGEKPAKAEGNGKPEKASKGQGKK